MKQDSPPFWYTLSYTEPEREIAQAEAEALLGDAEIVGAIAVSPARIDPSRAAYVSARLAPIARALDAEALLEMVRRAGLEALRFKVEVRHMHAPKSASYQSLTSALGSVIGGRADLERPHDRFWALETAAGWWFGRVEAVGARAWGRFAPKKEWTFSSALPPRLALACVNLACPRGSTFLDPCCGCGTLVLQAAAIGLTAVGADLNPKMVWLARKNLAHMSLSALVCLADARTIGSRFAGVATNLPYGKYLVRSSDLYEDIADNLASQTKRAVFVTGDECSHLWRQAGFAVTRVLRVPSGSVVRYVHLCLSESVARGAS